MSLDIEGAEEDVLRTLPFDKIDIEVILIEVRELTNKNKNNFIPFRPIILT